MTSHNRYSWSREHLNFVILDDKSRIITNENHANAFRTVDRGDFVPLKFKDIAYSDIDIDIGYGQFLNKPTTIASQIKYLDPKPNDRILEIGTGSGYLSAILGFIVGEKGEVIAIDRILSLINKTRNNIAKYPELNGIVEIVFKDGFRGYLEEAPFDAIIVSAYYEEIPEILKSQLKIKGRLIAPTTNNDLKIFTKTDRISIKEEIINGFIFDKISEGVE